MFTHLIDFLKRSPRQGDRKDPAMSTESAAPAPEAQPASASSATEAFDRQLQTLADAVRELSRSHQTLLDAVARKPHTPATPPSTISGDPGDGVRPSAVVDYTRLSSVQQIALGLRTATPQGPRVLPTRPPVPQPRSVADAEAVPAGAD